MTTEGKTRRWRLQDSERRLILLIGDFLAAAIATFIALYLWAQFDWFGFSWEFVRNRADGLVFLPLLWVILMLNLYDVQRAASLRETVRGVLIAAAGGVVLYLLVYFTSEPGSLPRRGVSYFLVAATLLTLLWRWLYIRVFTAPGFLRRVLIVGAGENGSTMIEVIHSLNPPPYEVVGFIDDDVEKSGHEIDGVPILGDSARLLEIVDREGVTDLIVAILGPMGGAMFQALLDAQEQDVQITRMPVEYEKLLGRLPIKHLESDWILRSFVDELRVSTFYLLIKRLIDIAGGLVGLGVTALTFPWVALAIVIESGRPIIYAQTRVGKGGREFQVVKYRTMRQDAEQGEAVWSDTTDDPRTTRVGRVLRRTHLDEFPQFWNVLRGEMSIVGPRPERPEFVVQLEKIIPFYRARLLVKPGITGWAQVNYGKGASVEGSSIKLEHDLYYIKHRSVLMDLWIILRTFGAMVGLRGV